MIGPVEEAGKTARSFFDALKEQPLSLALVVSNFSLLGLLLYSGVTYTTARRETAALIVAWQRESAQLMAHCVSSDIMQMVLKALERDRSDQSGRKPADLEPPKQ